KFTLDQVPWKLGFIFHFKTGSSSKGPAGFTMEICGLTPKRRKPPSRIKKMSSVRNPRLAAARRARQIHGPRREDGAYLVTSMAIGLPPRNNIWYFSIQVELWRSF